MKIGIITFHTALNYGAVLQTYATYTILIKMGNDVEIINYHAPFNEKRFAPKGMKYFFNIRNIANILLHNSYQHFNKSVFNQFITNHLKTTIPYYDASELFKLNEVFDTFISGSDQVWNLACTEGDDTYYLPFVDDLKKRNAYAVSLGYNQVPENMKVIYAKLINGFNNISVREKAGVRIVKELTDKDATLVLDPTLLLSRSQWKKIADFSKVPMGRYLLMYLMSEDKALIKFAKEFAKRKDLQIIYINQRAFHMKGAVNIKNITPEQWIGLFLRADTIVTNSFHGLVFSINFHKLFYTKYIPNSISNSRLETILDLLSLHNRRLGSSTYDVNSEIDYVSVDLELQELRKHSILYLKKIIDDGN